VKRNREGLDQGAQTLVFAGERRVGEVAADQDRVGTRIEPVDRRDREFERGRGGAVIVEAQVRFAELREESQTFLTWS
jgi:hypothetical protein